MCVENAVAGSIYIVMSVLMQFDFRMKMTVQTIDLLDGR